MKKIIETRWLVLIAMLALLIVPAVQAAMIVNVVSDEFSLGSPYPADNLKACECSQRTDILEVKNIGDFKALFTVNIDSSIKGLITLSANTFELAPGQENKVYVKINVPCGQPLDTFYVATVSTNYGRSKEITKQVVSQACQNIKYTSKVLNDKVLPGDTVTVQVDLQNVADFTDTYKITADAYQDFTVLSKNEVTLGPDEQKTIYMYVTYPLTYYGTFKYPFTITSEKAQNKISGFESFTIEKDYDFTMKTESFDLSTCAEVADEATVTFTNLANSTPNKYYLYLTAPSFAKLSQNSLVLRGGEQNSIKLLLNASKKDVGEYNLLLSAGTEYGDMRKDKNIKLKVNDCYESKATLESQASLITDKACCGDKNYTLNIRNDGMYEEAYSITVDSPDNWVKVRDEDSTVRIKPGQNINIPVFASFPCTDENQTAFVIVKQLRAPYQTHEIKLELQSLSQRSCYNVDLLQDKYRINYETNNMPLLIQNTGLKGGVYKLKLGELDSRFVYLDQDTMEFKPGETKVLHVYPKNYSDYKQGTYLNKLTLTISLVDQKLDIGYDRQFWVVLKDKNFITKAIDYIRHFNYSRIGWCGFFTLVLVALAVIMLIIVAYMRLKKDLKLKRIRAATMKKIRIVNIALICLLILSILALILIGSPDTSKFYEQSKKNVSNSSLYFEWKQNTPYQFDLNQYFTDPDKDVLSYTSSQPDHVDVKIEGSLVTLAPEHNWAGEEKIVFTANDKNGGVTDSPIITLSVLAKKPVGIMGYWNTYCKHINIVVLIIIILLVLLALDVIEEKGYNYYNPNKNKRK